MLGSIFGQGQQSPTWQQDPSGRGSVTAQLGQFFGNQAQTGYAGPQYTGQVNAPGNQGFDTAQSMFGNITGQYDPTRTQDIYGRYQNIADTGMMPQYQSYLDATTKAANNAWQQNVMPGVMEQYRGAGGRGSAVPEQIANAGQNFYTGLAGQMAPYAMQAANQSAQNRLQGTAGMGTTSQQMWQDPMNIANNALQYGSAYRTAAPGGQSDLDRQYQMWLQQNAPANSYLPYAIQYAGQDKSQFMYPQNVPLGLMQWLSAGIGKQGGGMYSLNDIGGSGSGLGFPSFG
jgi:hypothetical protein